MIRLSEIVDHPAWREYQKRIGQRLVQARNELTVCNGTLDEIRGLQHRIKDLEWIALKLPDEMLLQEREAQDRLHSHEGETLAGQEQYEVDESTKI